MAESSTFIVDCEVMSSSLSSITVSVTVSPTSIIEASADNEIYSGPLF